MSFWSAVKVQVVAGLFVGVILGLAGLAVTVAIAPRNGART